MLQLAVHFDFEAETARILKARSVLSKNKDEGHKDTSSCLSIAASLGYDRPFLMLLEHYATTNATPETYEVGLWDPLMYAILHKSHSIVNTLITKCPALERFFL